MAAALSVTLITRPNKKRQSRKTNPLTVTQKRGSN
jgi:hypothetical protein